MLTIRLNSDLEIKALEAENHAELPAALIVERWAEIGRLAESHPDMLAGDLITYLETGSYPSVLIEDAPARMTPDKESESVRMMMRMLVYALKQHAPGHSCVTRAMKLMKSMGMYSVRDILR